MLFLANLSIGGKHMSRFYRYQVQGQGDFPFDMLRYDRVYPVTEPCPSMYSSREAWRKVRTVDINGEGGTPARLASFGWAVRDAEDAVWGV